MTDQTESLWIRTTHPFPRLRSYVASPDATEDVIVIGAGIAGLSVALALLEEGRRVLVLEKTAIGAGQTLRTSAHLANALDDRFYSLERWHGQKGARHAAESHAGAIERIEHWCARYGIDCAFARIDGYLLAEGAADHDDLDREHEAASRAGLDVEPVAEAVDGLTLGKALRFRRQARIDPAAYLAGLAQAVEDRGGALVREEVLEIEGGEWATVRTAAGTEIQARAVIVATNVPFHEAIPVHTKQAPYRTFVQAYRIGRDDFPDILLWDMAEPYHYVRRFDDAASEASWLIVGGEDHKTGQGADSSPFPALDEWTRARIPTVGAAEWSWSGQVIEPVDGLAFVGRDPGGMENVYIVTGDSGNGLTHATLAAEVLVALVQGRAEPWDGLYDPRRKPIRALATWMSENANVAVQYGDWLAAGDARPLELREGTVVRQGVHRIAVSRGAEGRLHAFSAVCPHLGGSVRWNPIERTWDCPCHGSRFDPVDGHVLNGPSPRGLDPLGVPD